VGTTVGLLIFVHNIGRLMMSKKDLSMNAQFYNWLEQCPLERWQTIEEIHYKDHVGLNIIFNVPHRFKLERVADMNLVPRKDKWQKH
jgi:hypothetical protein